MMNNVAFLESILGKTLRLHTEDTRMFVGEFKCTDNVSRSVLFFERRKVNSDQEYNIILSQSYEYRLPTMTTVQAAAGASSTGTILKADMTSRFLGLIVVPGKYIHKIEIEED